MTSETLRFTHSAPALRRTDGGARLEFTGTWNLLGLATCARALQAELAGLAAQDELHWDLRAVEALDHAGALLLWGAWGRKRALHLSLRPEHEALFSHLDYPREEPAPGAPKDKLAPLIAVGGAGLILFDHLQGIVLLIGSLVLNVAYLARDPSRIPWREISANLYRTGAQALGITALVGALIGVVLSYLSAQQLKQFGADIFIINILGISVIRELGPMLAAILIAGRSGSAMTAQLGVMRVTQELDALTVMGISHSLRLVFPKVVALAISLPLTTLWTDAAALTGGMVSAKLQLGIGYWHFVSTLPDVVPIANIWLGLSKAIVFGMLIALIACHFGLRIRPNTESLGAGTTSSVVTAITIVIVVDAVFAVAFSNVGIS